MYLLLQTDLVIVVLNLFLIHLLSNRYQERWVCKLKQKILCDPDYRVKYIQFIFTDIEPNQNNCNLKVLYSVGQRHHDNRDKMKQPPMSD